MVESVIVISHEIEDSSEANLSRRLWGNIRIVKLHKYLLFLEKNSNLYNHVMAQIFFSKDKKHISTVLEDGIPPGGKVVENSWDSAVICPRLNCLDSDLSKSEIVFSVQQEMTSFSALPTVQRYFSIEVSALNTSSQEAIDVSGRCFVNESELLSTVIWTEGYDESVLSDEGVT